MSVRKAWAGSEEEGRAALVAEARSWLGCPYHHRAGLKGVGVDCAQLPLKVYANVGLIEDFDTGEYPAEWHLHRDLERYMKIATGIGTLIPFEAIKPGDLLLFKYLRVFSHGAIYVGDREVVHAHQRVGSVILANLDNDVDLIDVPRVALTYWPAKEKRRGR